MYQKGEMKMQEKRNYSVLENGPIYYSPDMDKTINWFAKVLKWYGAIDARDNDGMGVFGGIAPIPNKETEALNLTYMGINLLQGEHSTRVVAYVVVDDATKAFETMIQSGWDKYTPLVHQPWGGTEFQVTTIDGSIIRIASY